MSKPKAVNGTVTKKVWFTPFSLQLKADKQRENKECKLSKLRVYKRVCNIRIKRE